MLKFCKNYCFLMAFTLIIFASLLSADTLRVPSEYPDIQSALDDAFPGDQIVIAEGRYEENLEMKLGGVEIVGAGLESTIIAEKPPEGFVETAGPVFSITVLGGDNSTIRDLTVEGGTKGIDSLSGLTLRNVSVTGAEGDGITCKNSTYILDHVTIAQVGGIPLVCTDTSLTFNNGTIEPTEGDADGISATNSNLTLNTVTITQPGGNGIALSGGSLTANNLTITRSGAHGIIAGGSLTLDTVTINRAGGDGINNRNANFTLDNGIITRARGDGINITNGFNSKVRTSIITGNVGDGVQTTWDGVVSIPRSGGVLGWKKQRGRVSE